MLTKDDLTPEVLQAEFDSGLGHKEIAEKYHLTSRTIYDYVKKGDLKVERKNKKKEKVLYKCIHCGKEFTRLGKDNLCYNCYQHNQTLIKDEANPSSRSKYYNDIVKLRTEGLSHKQIAEKLGCSKSTVSYCLSGKTREKVKYRAEKWRAENEGQGRLSDHISNFRLRKYNENKITMCKDGNKKLRGAVSRFKQRNNMESTLNYSYKDVLEYFGGTIVTCELTGRTIDLTKDDYNIDHILPVSRGGTNELENMAFTVPEANAAKSNLTNDELVALCKEICEHFGYTVTKN